VDITQAKRIYFLAICGTAMASLAAMLKQMGYAVYGSDSGVYPPMSTFLAEQGIPVFDGFDPAHLNPPPDWVVVGNVISRGNAEIEEILDRHIPYLSLPEALREFCIRGRRSIVVTGTHGKTTTSSLLSWVFEYAGQSPSFLIGGIPNNFGRGFQIGSGRDIILEGDEYDSAFFDKAAKFLRYLPDIGVINHVEFDHADIYSSLDEIKLAFRRFVNLLPRNGLLAACYDFDTVREVCAKAFCPVQSFGLQRELFWSAGDVEQTESGQTFTVNRQGEPVTQVHLPMFGDHNIRNALAAIAVSQHAGIPMATIAQALAGFKSVKRRLELKGEARGVSVYDDFGHHPTAIDETLAGFRRLHPDKRIWALFEPRTATTRRSVFQNEMAHAFRHADVVLVSAVDRPDKAPAGQVFSCERLIADLLQNKQEAHYIEKVNDMVPFLLARLKSGDAVITFSNGFFGGIHDKLLHALHEQK
jgi:UDP-N-acetylmuramate: L-alanyl-gamma-D-glutamyl-meso-diaminopimelate ligase